MNISVDDIVDVFPRPLTGDEESRVEKLISQAVELIEMEFGRRHRSLTAEIDHSPWLAAAVKQAVRVMVSQAVLVGENAGLASVSATAGAESTSVTYSQGIRIHWGGVGIDSSVLELLGLLDGPVPLGRGGRIVRYGRRC